MQKKRWQDLTRSQHWAIMIAGVIQVTLLVTALVDIRRRPPGGINGSKRRWTAALFISFIGPIAYFLFGRKRETPTEAPAHGMN
jgi:hypothetical protein